MIRTRISAWLRQHGPTVVVALILFVGASFLTQTVRQVPENQARIILICAKVNAIQDELDAIVQKTTANANAPRTVVSDPAVQKLIDDGRRKNEEFKRFAAEQSKKARCHIQ